MAAIRKFVSKYPSHKLIMEPTRKDENKTIPGKSIQFVNHSYETSNKSEIEFLTNHRLFGADIIEEKVNE